MMNRKKSSLNPGSIDQMCFRLVKIGNKNHYLMLYYETDTGETFHDLKWHGLL